MNQKERIIKEIERQERIEPEKCQKDVLLMLLDCVTYDKEWLLLVDVKFHKYGIMSYECHRFYYPSTFAKKMIDNITKKLDNKTE